MGGKIVMIFIFCYFEFVDSFIVVDMFFIKIGVDKDIFSYLVVKRGMNLSFIRDKRDVEKMLVDVVFVSKYFSDI